jgi:hypothetical protein
VRSQPAKALDYYARAAQAQSQYRNLHHISWWESAVACLGLWRWVFGFVGAVAGRAVVGEGGSDTSWIYALFANADI